MSATTVHMTRMGYGRCDLVRCLGIELIPYIWLANWHTYWSLEEGKYSNREFLYAPLHVDSTPKTFEIKTLIYLCTYPMFRPGYIQRDCNVTFNL